MGRAAAANRQKTQKDVFLTERTQASVENKGVVVSGSEKRTAFGAPKSPIKAKKLAKIDD
jgi:microcompartment protein CcmK/EutM